MSSLPGASTLAGLPGNCHFAYSPPRQNPPRLCVQAHPQTGGFLFSRVRDSVYVDTVIGVKREAKRDCGSMRSDSIDPCRSADFCAITAMEEYLPLHRPMNRAPTRTEALSRLGYGSTTPPTPLYDAHHGGLLLCGAKILTDQLPIRTPGSQLSRL